MSLSLGASGAAGSAGASTNRVSGEVASGDGWLSLAAGGVVEATEVAGAVVVAVLVLSSPFGEGVGERRCRVKPQGTCCGLHTARERQTRIG